MSSHTIIDYHAPFDRGFIVEKILLYPWQLEGSVCGRPTRRGGDPLEGFPTSFPGLFPFELGRRPNSKGKSPGKEVEGFLYFQDGILKPILGKTQPYSYLRRDMSNTADCV